MLARIFLGHKGREMVSIPRRLALIIGTSALAELAATGRVAAAPKGKTKSAPKVIPPLEDGSPEAAMQRFQKDSKATVYNVPNGGAYIILEPKVESAGLKEEDRKRALIKWEVDSLDAGVTTKGIHYDSKGSEKYRRAILFVPNDKIKPETAYAQHFFAHWNGDISISDYVGAGNIGRGTMKIAEEVSVSCRDGLKLTFNKDVVASGDIQKKLDAGQLNISTNYPKNSAEIFHVYKGSDGYHYVQTRVSSSPHKLLDYYLHRLGKDMKVDGVSAMELTREGQKTSFGTLSGPFQRTSGSALTQNPEFHKLGDVVLDQIKEPSKSFLENLVKQGLKNPQGEPLLLAHINLRYTEAHQVETACTRPEQAAPRPRTTEHGR